MTETTDDKVRNFVLHELPLVTTLFLKKIQISDDVALQEIHEADDVQDMAEKYFHQFHVQPAGFSIHHYYPWKTKSKSCEKDKPPLTIRMFIESARSGRWLYQ